VSFGLLFSGQGTQHPAMLGWVDDADALVAQTQAALGVEHFRAALEDPAWAARNRNVQPLLTGIGLAAWSQLAPRLPAPAAVAGYSVGELPAFSAAGVFDAKTAVALAVARARVMDDAAERSPGGGLLAVTGLNRSAIERVCAGIEVSVAIHVDGESFVLGGAASALQAAARRADELGGTTSRLNVGLASHTPSMQPAAAAFAGVLQAVPLAAPSVPLFSDATGDRVHGAAEAARVLSAQIAQVVRWSDVMEAIRARRVACVLEIGPAGALAKIWNRNHPDIPARSADEFRSARAVVDWVLRRVCG
jgi:[acyl-carrier-protein] S-malonyltransferase